MLQTEHSPLLEHFFAPCAVAVVGASTRPGKVGHDILRNLIRAGFEGELYPINPTAPEVLGLKAYGSVKDVEGPIDLAVIVLPANMVANVLEECGDKGIDAAIVISAGFKETGCGRRRARKRPWRKWRSGGASAWSARTAWASSPPESGWTPSFAPIFPNRGNIALMSQSGALATAIIDWSVQNNIGFSKFVSFGNGVDVGPIDLLRAWENDEETKVIVAYIEGLPNGPEFIRVAREVSHKKPIIVVKSGSTQAGARAVSSHTGSLAGSEQAYDAAFMQSGVIRAHSVEEMFDYAVAFAYQTLPKSRKVAVLTNVGGPGIMATDELERQGLSLATIDPATVERLRTKLPDASNFYNPVDCLGDADAERYTFTAESVLADPNVDAVIALLTPQTSTQPLETAEGLSQAQSCCGKPVLSCFMGGGAQKEAIVHLAECQIPNYPYPERAVDSLAAMIRYREWREEPEDELVEIKADREKVRAIFDNLRAEGRLGLGEMEAREVLMAYGLAMPDYRLATSAEEAADFAEEIGFPVVMKIVSPDILHKSDIGGVKVGVADRQEAMDVFELMMLRAKRLMPSADLRGVSVQEMVRTGREVIVGANRDPQFGPLVMFGLGGIYVEVLKDVTFRVAPFGQKHAWRMVEEIRTAALLHGAWGERPADIDAIVKCSADCIPIGHRFPGDCRNGYQPAEGRRTGGGGDGGGRVDYYCGEVVLGLLIIA